MPTPEETEKLVEETRERRRKAFSETAKRITKDAKAKKDAKPDESETDE